ncbi:MAG TPA: VOC family protein [Devosiaceae bacterium]|jgi:catechol 2,3-dioxygenase-like lactoylglutathione lyase family enzyme|nr:VOC family protein [Devosiaceae bacterium]
MQPKLNRVLFNVLVKDMAASVDFYRRIVDLQPIYESDWFVVLTPQGQPNVQIGLIDQVSEFAPRHAWGNHEGAYMTFVVDDVFGALQAARELGVEVIEEPVALEYGQTRLLVRDPNGMILDLSTPTAELADREDVDFVGTSKSTAIDQRQPEERDSRATH